MESFNSANAMKTKMAVCMLLESTRGGLFGIAENVCNVVLMSFER